MNFLRAISDVLRFDRTNWKALALCFCAAGIFWIFNALNKNYASNLRFPLKFEFDDTRYVAVDPLPSTLTLNVSGNGWEILRRNLGLKVPSILLPLDRPTETRKIAAANLSPVVATQIGALQVNFVVTDTLRLKIEPKTTRKVKLAADIATMSFKKGLGAVSPIVVLPDSVLLDGPKSLIENFADTIFLRITGSRISRNFRETVEVSVPNGDVIIRNPPVAEVMFEVGPMEEFNHAILLRVGKFPTGVEMDRDSIRCTFRFPAKEHDRFQTDVSQVYVELDPPEVPKGATRSFLPVVRGLPEYAQLIHVDSVKVKRY